MNYLESIKKCEQELSFLIEFGDKCFSRKFLSLAIESVARLKCGAKNSAELMLLEDEVKTSIDRCFKKIDLRDFPYISNFYDIATTGDVEQKLNDLMADIEEGVTEQAHIEETATEKVSEELVLKQTSNELATSDFWKIFSKVFIFFQ